ncbi:hypothetical protein DYB37_003615 [Aphanomyces astaci]|uniref:Alkaline ceramidase n=1 Tax=Aphanomyces astaci TaxID=112090 RepID=A0A3R6XTK9_APHAT|nr:hypothetical protein DYB35_003599 [Aphanomyces astaci]RHZ22637.1 hypothetical protein DYB37_003615 [Aphanomyces astaci]
MASPGSLAASLFDALVSGHSSIQSNASAAGDAVGFWSPATAAINWCEVDYESSYYVAEFWNTLTNAAYVAVGLCAISRNRKAKQEAHGYSRRAAVCCCLTGVFSGLFHATLWMSFQRLDEVFETGILVFLYHEHATGAALGHFILAATAILLAPSTSRVCEVHLVVMILATIINVQLHAWWHLWTALALHFGFQTHQILFRHNRTLHVVE